MELQDILGTLREHDFALFAVSYDSVSVLAEFAQRHGIEYPLLSDEGSQVIRALGLLDEDLDTHHAEFGGQVRDEQRGVTYPGVFVLDEHGVIAQRRFQRNYRVRESGHSLLAQALGIADDDSPPAQKHEGNLVEISAALDSPTYWRYQRLQVIVDVQIAPGAHVFAQPSPVDYTPLRVEVSANRAVIGEPSWPEAHPFQLEGLDERLWVYEGSMRVCVPLEFVMERGEGMGDQPISVRVGYQACTET
ncbi:MAG TPA: redoxin domain-containing protein, partial [Chloroflexota bacterium]|nr:redoxin domain-containing protein [Chloroflexota bacterium]